MLVLWLMAAAAATVPGLPDLGRPIDERGRPVAPTIWLWNDDYTSDMGRTGGAVRFAVSYKPDGTFTALPARHAASSLPLPSRCPLERAAAAWK